MTEEEQRAMRYLEEKVEALEETLRTLIAWTAQSAISPINMSEAGQLLQMLPAASNDKGTPDDPVCIGCGECQWQFKPNHWALIEGDAGVCRACYATPEARQRWANGVRTAPEGADGS